MLAMMMPGAMEMVIIGIVAVLLFGSRLPKVAFSLGNSLTQFKKGVKDSAGELEEVKNILETHRNELGAAVTQASSQQAASKA